MKNLIAAFALVLALTPAAGWGQDQSGSRSNWFRVNWHPGVVASTIEGNVGNSSPYRAVDVRLLIEGLDAANHRIGARLVWAGSDIAPGGSASYFAATIPGAVSYRVTVVSFELVSEDGGLVADVESAPSR